MFFANAMNSVTRPSLPKSKSQQTVVFDVFKDHWRQVLAIFNKSLVNDDDIQIVKSNLAQMVALLVDELNQVTNAVLVGKTTSSGEVKFSGPLWDYLLATNIFETVYLWSLSYPEYLYDLKYEQLRNYEELISQMQTNEQTNLLLYRQLHRPLFSLLNHCSSHNSELIERYMISILNQLCVCMCKNSSLLNIFFDYNANGSGSGPGATMQPSTSMFINETSSELILERSANEKLARSGHAHSKSFIFTLLIPYIHKEGSLGANCGSLTFGQQARDALLMIMQLSSRNQNLAKYIVYSTDFCPILATGLSGLYSELPQKLTQHENFEEIRYLQKDDIIRIHSLNKFINSLEFCNNVIQVSHSLIANQLLQYVYYGFLVPVIAPALTQDVVDKFPVELVQLENYTNCMDEIVSATLYLDLFLRTINEPNLLRVFLKFILFSKFDERMTLLDTLINRINSSTKLSLATLMLFHTMIDLNSEDVIYKLILTYIIPCKHLMKSQLVTLKQSSCEINGLNAQAFLSLSTNFISSSDNSNRPQQHQQQQQQAENNESNHNLIISNYSSLNENSPVYRWLNTFMETTELDSTLTYLENIRFNYVDYLKDAKKGILNTADKTSKWSFRYDVSEKNSALMTTPTNRRSNTTTTTASSSSSKSPSGVQLTPNQVAVQPSLDLDADVEEFFFNLNVSLATNAIAETKSVRSTINLGREQSTNDTDSFVDYDTNSINSEKTAGKRSTTTATTTTTTTVTRRRRNSSNRKTPGQQRRRKNKRENDAAPNDFYILSFDNEISESEEDDDDGEDAENYEEVQLEDDDEDDIESVSSIASSKCSSVDTTTVNNNNNDDEIERQNLIDYLFSNEENNRIYLNSNLNNFLSGLENYFSDKPINNSICNTKSSSSSKKKKKTHQLDKVCEEISKLYEDLIISTTPTATTPINPPQVDQSSMTQFPSYEHNEDEEVMEDTQHQQEMTSSSSNSMSQPTTTTADSGVELWSYSQSTAAASTDDLVVAVGPFLCAILNRLEHLLSNSLQINFLVTGIFARLAFYPQLLLRSFLLNNSLVLQPNVKSLIQVLGNVKYKIDACSRTYNNFSLLYLRAKVNLVKRLVDSNMRLKQQNASLKSSPSSTFSNHTQQLTSQTTPPTSKKKLIVDRILSIFKPDSKENVSPSSLSTSQSNQKPIDINSPMVELDLDEVKMKFIKSANNDSSNAQQHDINTNDFLMADSEWEDVRTRNIAFNAVIFDEFVKELAAVCQEHSVLVYDNL